MGKWAKQALVAVAITLGCAANPCYAQPVTASLPAGLPPSQATNTTASVLNVSTTVTLAKPSRHVVVKTDPTAAVIYVDFTNNTATSADFRIEPGAAVTYEGQPISAFKYIGASAAGTYSVLAH